MEQSPFVPLARIVGAHGLKGEVKVAVLVPEGAPLDGLSVWVVPPSAGINAARIESVRGSTHRTILKLSGVDSIDDAARLRDCTIMASANDVPKIALSSEQPSVIGMQVHDDSRGHLGEVTEVILTGANDVWVVEGERFGQVLIPAISDVIVAVDPSADAIRVRLLEGLIDDDR